MVRNFKGQVKISDVQAEFDSILASINDLIDEYNNSAEISADVDYSVGSPFLGQYDYTLTVGGLKSALEAYEGAVLYTRAYSDNHDNTGNYQDVIMTKGLLVHNGSVISLPQATVSGNGNLVVWDVDNSRYKIIDRSSYIETRESYTSGVATSNSSQDGTFSATGGNSSAYKCTSTTTNNLKGWVYGLVKGKKTASLTWTFPFPVEIQTIKGIMAASRGGSNKATYGKVTVTAVGGTNDGTVIYNGTSNNSMKNISVNSSVGMVYGLKFSYTNTGKKDDYYLYWMNRLQIIGEKVTKQYVSTDAEDSDNLIPISYLTVNESTYLRTRPNMYS